MSEAKAVAKEEVSEAKAMEEGVSEAKAVAEEGVSEAKAETEEGVSEAKAVAEERVSEAKAVAEREPELSFEADAVEDEDVPETVDCSATESKDSVVRYGLSHTACTACLITFSVDLFLI